MTSSWTWRRWRWIAGAAQALVALGLPFVTVRGESALRLDVPAGRLHAFGLSLAVDEAFVVLAATLLLAFLFILVTLLWGRAWCGWACPQTVLGDLTAWVEPEQRRRKRRWRRPAGFAVTALVSAVVGASVTWYFVSPYEWFPRLARGELGPVLGWSWGVVGGIVFLDLAFLRQRFCATACPYAKLQGVLFDRHTLVVAYDERRDADCVDCGACVRVCPTGIDIRDGLQMECIACAQCIDACRPVMLKLKRAPDLVGYFHGEPGARPRPVRPSTLAAAALSAASLALLVGAVWSRDTVAVTVLADAAFAPRRGADGRVVNAFAVTLENHGRAPVTVALAVEPGVAGAGAAVRPDRVELAAGERRRVRLLATVQGLAGGGTFRGALRTESRPGPGGDGAAGPAERRSAPLSIVAPEVP